MRNCPELGDSISIIGEATHRTKRVIKIIIVKQDEAKVNFDKSQDEEGK
jgi:hypothetical protein